MIQHHCVLMHILSSSRNTFSTRFKINVQVSFECRRKKNRLKKKKKIKCIKGRTQTPCHWISSLYFSTVLLEKSNNNFLAGRLLSSIVEQNTPNRLDEFFWLKRILIFPIVRRSLIKLSTVHPLRRCHHIDNDSACNFHEWNEKKIPMVIARDTAQRSYSNDRMNATESRQAATRLTFWSRGGTSGGFKVGRFVWLVEEQRRPTHGPQPNGRTGAAEREMVEWR